MTATEPVDVHTSMGHMLGAWGSDFCTELADGWQAVPDRLGQVGDLEGAARFAEWAETMRQTIGCGCRTRDEHPTRGCDSWPADSGDRDPLDPWGFR